MLDSSIIHDHREALAARAHAEFRAVHDKPHSLGEIAIAVGEHRHLAIDARSLAPGAHDEGVVDGGAGDLVDALGLELIGMLDETRQMLGRTGRGEGAGHGEQRNALAGEEFIACHALRPFGRRLDEHGGGKLVANGNGHGASFRVCLSPVGPPLVPTVALCK